MAIVEVDFDACFVVCELEDGYPSILDNLNILHAVWSIGVSENDGLSYATLVI